MSEKQKEDLAWATRIITITLLGIASVMGMSVYHKVDEMYSDFSKQKEINDNLKKSQVEIRQDFKELSIELEQIRATNYELKDRINNFKNN